MDNRLQKAPLMRIFKLKVASDKLTEFSEIGQHNLTTSIAKEPGTLAMYSTSSPDEPSTFYIAEIYENTEAYEKHVASEHFQSFASFAAEHLTDRLVYQLHPQWLKEKAEAISAQGKDSLTVKLAEVDVKTESNQAFRDIVVKEMAAAMEKETGVLAMYAATLADNPASWRFFEIYADNAAYEKHRQTQHFKTYIEQTAEMVQTKKLLTLTADILVNQGGLFFDLFL
ncbi:antibiotic biosynthesis monooxygenase [Streptococcus chenjunshii]|uniref:Antibiotic biosynthesis monooxygenase n=1 Tax=Streptococcus chenjunshii TaxID=2173853 RepID=A0A372KQ20_9STRE|nr:antibiotic biosynthesis monooxygenase [Streptococcus chenjunshii]AXQ78847.1 antibiotic biosynthesis monooxygenase [Streptococcus chenjunshii]RFU51608.1 antibiotic biosynthesis monooxygenase [Streptococcus chenjunshii]RFU53728.1 antibiotic biosynthesis monooxygenase [Streptococcus chenjunshii]